MPAVYSLPHPLPAPAPPPLPQLGATTVAQLRKALPGLVAEAAQDPYAEESLYRWSFRFCLTVRAKEPGAGCCAQVQAAG